MFNNINFDYMENNNEIKEKMQMVEYKDSVFKRIINKILNFLHLR